MYIGGVAKLLDENGAVNGTASAFFLKFVERFAAFVGA
jgi:hypothetical protein